MVSSQVKGWLLHLSNSQNIISDWSVSTLSMSNINHSIAASLRNGGHLKFLLANVFDPKVCTYMYIIFSTYIIYHHNGQIVSQSASLLIDNLHRLL